MSLTHCVSHCNIVRITNVYWPALFFNYRVRRGGEEPSTHIQYTTYYTTT